LARRLVGADPAAGPGHHFEAPGTRDADDTRRIAHLLTAILRVGILTDLVFAPTVALLMRANRGRSLAINAALLLVLGGLLALVRSGRVRLASRVLVLSVWVYVSATLWLFGGLRAPLLSLVFLLVFCAAMLLGYRAALAALGLCLVSSLAVLVADLAGLLPAVPQPTPAHIWVVFMSNLVLFVGLTYLATAELQRANRSLRGEVDERRRMEAALRESEARFRSIIEASPMGTHLYELGADGRLVLTAVNPAAEAMLGIEGSSYVGKSIEEAFPALVATDVPERYRRICSDGTPWSTDEISYEDERIRGTYEVHAFQTAPGKMATMFLDVTERRRAQEARRDLEERLRQSQKMEAVGRLAGGVAHEFNNLLMVIMGHGELLRRGLDPAGPQAGNLRHIMNAAERAARLVRQLLAFGRKQVLEPQVVDLNLLVGETARMLRPLLGEDVRLLTRLDPSLGRVRVDPAQVDQVLMNLAVNARDAMPGGGTLSLVTANCTVTEGGAVPAGRYVVLSVSDTGSGMDEQTRAHLFEPFFTTKLDGAGTGLGLAMVYGIVQQSGGHITVESAAGEGSAFRIFLPRADEEQAATRRGTGPTPAVCGRETILVVEDEPSICEVARGFLEGLGYSVFCAASGQEALSLSERHAGPIHLLLADVAMPGMNGRTLAERLVGLRPQIRVLYMSGYAGAELENRGVTEEAGHFLPKPFTQEALAARVRAILDRSA
jgi:PAS domain S-box-containing protein